MAINPYCYNVGCRSSKYTPSILPCAIKSVSNRICIDLLVNPAISQFLSTIHHYTLLQSHMFMVQPPFATIIAPFFLVQPP